MDAAVSTSGRKPGRPRNAASETPQARLLRLQREMREAQAALDAEAARKASIIGAAVILHASKEPGFRSDLAALLRQHVKAKADRADVAEWLVEGVQS